VKPRHENISKFSQAKRVSFVEHNCSDIEMSKTGIVWLIIYLGGFAASFVYGPIYGLLTYMFTFYTMFSWAKSVRRATGLYRVSFYAGVVFLISYLLGKKRLKKKFHLKSPQLKWLILISINMLVVSVFAVDPKGNKEVVIQFLKTIGLYYLIINVIRTKKDYKLFIWQQLWGNFLFGWQAFGGGKTRGGRLEEIGGPGIENSNYLANHLIMICPFIGNMVLFCGKWERIAVILASPFILNAIILCNSRGAFLAIIVMLLILLLFSQKQVKKKIVFGAVLGSILFLQLADENFWSRTKTITTYTEDGSATSRLDTWLAALRMISDYPYGQGGEGWEYYSPEYIPAEVASHGGQARSVHNTFLQVTTNFGIQGLILYLIFIANLILELHNMRKRYGTNDDRFYHTESLAIEVSLIGFLVAGFFGDRAFAEPFYWFCALATALSNMQQNELELKIIPH